MKLRRAGSLALFVACLVVCALGASACGSETGPSCVQGDQMQCRCGDGTYGYRACDPSGGFFDGGCHCTIGLSPDASAPDVSSR